MNSQILNKANGVKSENKNDKKSPEDNNPINEYFDENWAHPLFVACGLVDKNK